ncbi:MAG: hypothetical protein QXE38_04155 [Candidatus Methanomethylicia archaeon]
MENVDEAFNRIVQKIESSDGKLIRRRKINSGIEITFSVKRELEEKLLKDISLLGKMRIKKEGFRDKEGNIVLIIFKRGAD